MSDNKLTKEEFCKKYGITMHTLEHNFKRTQKGILRRDGVLVTKEGYGKDVRFTEKKIFDKENAYFFGDSWTDILRFKKQLTAETIDFFVFFAIVSAPMHLYRGTIPNFLKYLGENVSEANAEMLEISFLELIDRDLITYIIDEDIIILSLKRKAELALSLGKDITEICKGIAKKSGYNWIFILKVWIGLYYFRNEDEIDLKEFCETIDVSKDRLKIIFPLLEPNIVFRFTGCYYILKDLEERIR